LRIGRRGRSANAGGESQYAEADRSQQLLMETHGITLSDG